MISWLEKFEELRLRIPRMALHNTFSVNSDYVNYGLKNKNCYMLVSAIYNEDCYFGHRILSCKDCVDNQNISKCTLCYECSDCANCYNCGWCQDCFDCNDCDYCFDCKGCGDCFGCVGLRHKKYCIYNEQFSCEEYFNRLPKILESGKDQSSGATGPFNELLMRTPRMFSRQINVENCTGDYIYNSKNCFNSYIIDNCEDCGYLFNCGTLKDCYDADFDDESQLNYEVLSAQNSFNLSYCYACWYSKDIAYCDMCFNCSKCFLCAGLNKKKFFILNEEYSEKDFEKKFAEIKSKMIEAEEWGNWFSSPFPYEDSAAAVFC